MFFLVYFLFLSSLVISSHPFSSDSFFFFFKLCYPFLYIFFSFCVQPIFFFFSSRFSFTFLSSSLYQALSLYPPFLPSSSFLSFLFPFLPQPLFLPFPSSAPPSVFLLRSFSSPFPPSLSSLSPSLSLFFCLACLSLQSRFPFTFSHFHVKASYLYESELVNSAEKDEEINKSKYVAVNNK